MTKKGLYRCSCGARLQVKQIVKNRVTHCPRCKEMLPQKKIMRQYRKAGERVFRLDCVCGKVYEIAPPTGDFEFRCGKCGRFLLSIKRTGLNGVVLPRYIDSVQEKNLSEVKT